MRALGALAFCVAIGCVLIAGEPAKEAQPGAKAEAVEPRPTSEKIPVILDTDIGSDIDDTWALIMALRCPRLDIKLITTTNGAAQARAALIAKLLTAAKRTDIPVGLGAGKGNAGYQTSWCKGFDLKSYPGKVLDDGVQAMVEAINNSPQPVTIIAIGPLETVAAALEKDPKIAAKAIFVGMEGSLGGKEYNVTCNVPAAQKVLAAPWRQTIITPLQSCGRATLSAEHMKKINAARRSDPLLEALIENWGRWISYGVAATNPSQWQPDKSSTLYDTVAVYLAMGDRQHAKMEELTIAVTDAGVMNKDPNGARMLVATEWKDLNGYLDLLVKIMTDRESAAGAAKPGADPATGGPVQGK
jgi:inosine-uridine nucleoside N-ribohydrolase